MSITFRIDPQLSYYTGNKGSTVVTGTKVGECLDELLKRFPGLAEAIYDDQKQLEPAINFYINGNYVIQGLSRPVKDGDKLDIVLTEL